MEAIYSSELAFSRLNDIIPQKMLKKQLRKSDKGRLSSFELGNGADNFSP
jgi:hypothetical protein